MAKEKQIRRITMYVDVTDSTVINRIEVDGVARMKDDDDLGEWVNKSKNFVDGENPPNAIVNMIKTRLGIT